MPGCESTPMRVRTPNTMPMKLSLAPAPASQSGQYTPMAPMAAMYRKKSALNGHHWRANVRAAWAFTVDSGRRSEASWIERLNAAGKRHPFARGPPVARLWIGMLTHAALDVARRVPKGCGPIGRHGATA